MNEIVIGGEPVKWEPDKEETPDILNDSFR